MRAKQPTAHICNPLRTFADHRIIAGMRLRDYFAGQRFHLRSSLSARAVAESINRDAGSTFWPFATGIVGGVWAGHIRLRYRSSLFEYNAKPVLAGRIHESAGGSSLDLCYRAPIRAYAFYPFWYLFLAFFAVELLANGWIHGVTAADMAMSVAVLSLFAVFPVGLHAFGTRRSEEELAELLEFLSQYAEPQR